MKIAGTLIVFEQNPIDIVIYSGGIVLQHIYSPENSHKNKVSSPLEISKGLLTLFL